MEIEHVSEGCTCKGKKCTKCGLLLCVGKYTKNNRLKSKLKSQCSICTNKESKAWRQQNSQYDNDRKRAWEKSHPEQTNAQRKRRSAKKRKTNRRAPSHNRTSEERQEMWREGNLKQYHKNRQSNIARVMQYFQSHPGYRAVIESNRRARKREAGGAYTFQEWEDLKIQYDYTCLCCGKREPDIKLTADHVVPVTRGGHSFISNIQPLCKPCNSSKGQKIIDFRPKNP